MWNIIKYLYKDSILEVLNIQKYEQKLQKYRNENLTTKIIYGIKSNVSVLFKSIIISSMLPYILSKFINDQPILELNKNISLWSTLIIGPLCEEILFRGIEQNSIKYLQQYLPEPLSSTSLRIIVTTMLFASIHLFNAGIYLTKSQAITQCLILILYPHLSAIYEKTDSLFVSCIAHISSNLLVTMLIKILTRSI